MNQDIFTNCFKELCASFDLDYVKKKAQEKAYYNSKLSNMSEYDLLNVIKKARETLIVKPGYLPPIQQLLSIHYNSIQQPQKTIANKENFNQAKCAICDGTGFVVMEKDGYTYSGMCCSCKIGQIKQQATIIGRNSGCYKDHLDQGYKVHVIEASKNSKIKDKLLKVAYEAQKEEIPF